ncbi:ribonuclease H-like domain-containing protein, partial [Tanacetum coccineum]
KPDAFERQTETLHWRAKKIDSAASSIRHKYLDFWTMLEGISWEEKDAAEDFDTMLRNTSPKVEEQQNKKVLGSGSVVKKMKLKAYTCDIDCDDGPKPILQDPTAFVWHWNCYNIGSATLMGRSIVEMKTGEGKTLVSTLASYLNALAGESVHDYPIWEVIQNGNGPVSITTDTQGQIKVLPPRTAEEILARERERKARTTLLMALPEDHLAKFHKMTDAKEMWDAIKSRFGGNDESKKMQKYILKQQFEGFSVSNSEGLHKGYDRFQSLLSQLEIHGAGQGTKEWTVSALYDCNYNLRVFENDVKGSTASPSSTQNVAFISENTISTNDVSTAYGVSNPSGLTQVEKLQFNLIKEPIGFDKSSRVSVTIVTRQGILLESAEPREIKIVYQKTEEDYALMACNSSDTEVTSCLKECKESYAKLKKLYDEQRAQLSDFDTCKSDSSEPTVNKPKVKDKVYENRLGYTQGLKKVKAQLVAHQQGQLWFEEKIRFMKIDLDDKTDVLTYHKKLLAEAQ